MYLVSFSLTISWLSTSNQSRICPPLEANEQVNTKVKGVHSHYGVRLFFRYLKKLELTLLVNLVDYWNRLHIFHFDAKSLSEQILPTILIFDTIENEIHYQLMVLAD